MNFSMLKLFDWKRMKNKLLLIIVVLTAIACNRPSTFVNDHLTIEDENNNSNAELLHEVYLLGDVGDATNLSGPVLSHLKKEIDKTDQKNNAIIFLGDNIYPEGLHAKDHPLRKEDESRINAQLNIVKDYEGEVVFIPGNHDWKKGKANGYEFIKRQEDYIQDYLDDKVFRPSDGCIGPNDIEMSDDLTLIFIDTQWWLHDKEKGRGEADDCDVSTKAEFLAEFKELLKKNRNKHVIVAGHHPLFSNGIHGGKFPIADHIFPLRNVNEKLWIPLPFIGSIYPFYRSFIGNAQDIAHPNYQSLKKELIAAMSAYDNVIYTAGHEHNLQYLNQNRIHHIVSGSGSKVTPLRFNKKLDFGARTKGYSKISVYKDGSVYMSFYDALNGEESAPIITSKLYEKEMLSFGKIEGDQKPSYAGKFKTVIPDSTFAASKFKRLFFGDLNRDIWTTPIKVPYLDIHHVFGGLKPVGKGGGMQTLSLKMEAGNGKVYKLRAIKKSAKFLVDSDLRGTLAEDIIYDGIAASHPYASIVVPDIAEAGEIYYTKPELVYLPNDPILGDFQEEFGGVFCLLEVHPDDDMSTYENFGNTEKIVNYHKAIKKLESKQDHKVDVNYAVRARLLDMFLGDWDRHDDQWRWATFKEEDYTLYRPIPRDRDQVFFQFDGIIPTITNRKWLIRKFQHFEEDVRDVSGLNFNARYFDRYFLIEADREVWIEQAKKLQDQMNDAVIQSALDKLPKESYAINGDDLYNLLKARRANLLQIAERYYQKLAVNVDIWGSMDKDYFEVIRLENGDVEVNVYPRKDGDKVESERFYHRLFRYKETKEIRLYGLNDKDEYEISGNVDRSIKVRIIAADDKDKLKDNSTVKGLSKKSIFYDIEGEAEIESSSETKVIIEPDANAYFFNRKDFVNDKLLPVPDIGFNENDGFMLGPGFQFKKQGFKSKPYKYMHQLKAHYAFKTEGYSIDYENDYIQLIGGFDLRTNVFIHRPEVYNFFGQGNETEPTESELVSSNVSLNRYELKTAFAKSSDDLSSRFNIHLNYQVLDLEEIDVTPIHQTSFDAQDFIISGFSYHYYNVDQAGSPSKGLSFKVAAEGNQGLQNDDVSFVRLTSEVTLYMPINISRKQTVFAVRSGFAKNFGDYNFYQANFLSGLYQFRGITRNRFAGESTSYSNAEIRKSFFKVKNYVLPFDLGLVAHTDVARVWVDGENSDKWHASYGGGVFMSILNYMSIVGTYSISDVDRLFYLGTNFYF